MNEMTNNNELPPIVNTSEVTLEDGKVTYTFMVETIEDLCRASAYANKRIMQYTLKDYNNIRTQKDGKKRFSKAIKEFMKKDMANRHISQSRLNILIDEEVSLFSIEEQELLKQGMDNFFEQYEQKHFPDEQIGLGFLSAPHGRFEVFIQAQKNDVRQRFEENGLQINIKESVPLSELPELMKRMSKK